MEKTIKNTGIGPLEERLLSILEYKKTQIIRREELIKLIREYVGAKDITDLIARLQRKKRLVSIQKGVYAVIPISSINKVPQLSDMEVVAYLIKDNYYFGLYNAFNLHGFTEQIPNRLFVYNTKYSGDKKLLGFNIKFFKLKKDKIFGIFMTKYPYSDKERTIIDVLENYHYVAPLQEILDKIKESKYDKQKLVEYSIVYGSIKVMKLVGLITNNPKLYQLLYKKGTLKYYTSLKKTGIKLLNKKWKVRLI